MVANIELEKSYSFILHSYDGPSSSSRKSVENAHGLIDHTYGMMSQIGGTLLSNLWRHNCEYFKILVR